MKVSRVIFSVAAVLASSGLALAAPIAVLGDVTGQVSIQTSKGIVPAKPGAQLSEGDRLAVGQGTATVSYLGGKCKGAHEVGPRSIAVISSSEERCLKRLVGAKAQSLGPDIPDIVAPLVLVGVGGGLAAGLAASNSGGNSGFPFFPVISP